mmetsp:Transcript_73999/g.205665  ORF Transcript_73999/g.205665 Transcript_73999/m.205665 type:complete len:275 (+) Transcript_73999:56-880(+)
MSRKLAAMLHPARLVQKRCTLHARFTAIPWALRVPAYSSGFQVRLSAWPQVFASQHDTKPSSEKAPRERLPEGSAEPEEPEFKEPERLPKSSNKVYASEGVGLLTLLTLPSRHVVWTVALWTLGLRFPSVWNSSDFYEGVEFAINAIFQHLSAGDTGSLTGLVESQLIARLRKEVYEHDAEQWAVKPVQQHVRVLGLLWAKSVGDLHGQGPGLQVELAVYSREAYQYRRRVPDSVVLRRLQRWTFERPIDASGSWTVVGISAEPWHLLHPFGPE